MKREDKFQPDNRGLLVCFTSGIRDYIGLVGQQDGSVVNVISSKPGNLIHEFDSWDATC